MKKYNVLVSVNDGRAFYQNFHVIASSPEAAFKWLIDNFPHAKFKATVKLQQIEQLEDAELFLPGIVYKSGKAYFNK